MIILSPKYVFFVILVNRLIALGSPSDESSFDKKQLVHVFEGTDAPYGSSGPPIELELRSTISLKLDATSGIITLAVHSKGNIY